MNDLTTVEGIVAEIRQASAATAPACYVPLLKRCAVVRRHGIVDAGLAAELEDYASIMAAHGLLDLADRLRTALPPEMPQEAEKAPAP